MVVCQTGPVEAVELLLKHNADVSRATRGSGSTPLHIALQNGHLDAARLLLERGAEVDQTRKDGATSLYIACEKGHVEAARLLLDNGRSRPRGDGALVCSVVGTRSSWTGRVGTRATRLACGVPV